MEFEFLGTRGSYPTQKEEHLAYGGKTPCVEVRGEDSRLILDAGTGILGLDLDYYLHQPRIDILLTHLHMDHIQGLAFFKPLFRKDTEIHIWGPGGSSNSLKSRLNRYLSPPLFPVMMRELPCRLHIHEIGNNSFSIGPFSITSAFVIHPGPTVGYRIETQSKVLTYIPDHEPMVGAMELYEKDRWVSGLQLCEHADALIHDAMYTDQEYPGRHGWGHSATDHAIQLARRAGVKRLFLFHHNPEYTDAFMEAALENIPGKHRKELQIRLAVQGQTYEV